MEEAIVLFVFAAIAAGIAFLIRNTGKAKRETKKADAVITRIYEGGGARNYFVTFVENGEELSGKSVSYPSSEKHLHRGDNVQIEYYFTKGGWPRVIILDEELKSSAQSSKNAPKIVAGISAAFFAVGVIYAIKDLL